MSNVASRIGNLILADFWVFIQRQRVVHCKIKLLNECDPIDAYSDDKRLSLTLETLSEYLGTEISRRRASIEDKAKVQFQVFAFASAAMFLGTSHFRIQHAIYSRNIISLGFHLVRVFACRDRTRNESFSYFGGRSAFVRGTN